MLSTNTKMDYAKFEYTVCKFKIEASGKAHQLDKDGVLLKAKPFEYTIFGCNDKENEGIPTGLYLGRVPTTKEVVRKVTQNHHTSKYEVPWGDKGYWDYYKAKHLAWVY